MQPVGLLVVEALGQATGRPLCVVKRDDVIDDRPGGEMNAVPAGPPAQCRAVGRFREANTRVRRPAQVHSPCRYTQRSEAGPARPRRSRM